MKIRTQWLATAIAAAALPSAHASPPSELCEMLRSFVESVQPGEVREFTFRTSWGSNFKDVDEPAIAAKRCNFNGYEPAMVVCAYLAEHGSTEFAGINVKNTISCLSRETNFGPTLRLASGDFSLRYGSDDRGALIDISLQQDEKVGGMAFQLTADGY